jgi:RecA-family ATPase
METIKIEQITRPPSSNGHKMLHLSEWRELVLAQPATDDLVQDILPDCPSEYLLICGRSGIGKTNLALDLACCLASGKPWFSFKTKPCKVGYLVFEGAPKKLLARVDKLLQTYPDALQNLYFDREMPFKLSGPGIQRFQSLIEGLRVIFVDPIRYIVPGDYTKPDCASNFISTLKAICQKAGTVAVLIHHVKKPDNRVKIQPQDLQYEVKGATDYVDAASTLLLLERARQARKVDGRFGSNTDDRILHFCKVKDSPTEILPLNLRFNRTTLVYEPISQEYPDEDEF